MNHAANFVRDFLIVKLAEKDLIEIWNPANPVEYLNDILHKQNKSPAEPRLIGQAGQNTLLAVYHVAMYSDKIFLGSGNFIYLSRFILLLSSSNLIYFSVIFLGFGQTIQEAKNVAAINVLSKIFGLSESSKPIKFNNTVTMSS